MPYKKYEDSVEQILENLKHQPAPSNDSAVDSILSDLGFEHDPALADLAHPAADAGAQAARPTHGEPEPEPMQPEPEPMQEQQRLRSRFEEAVDDTVQAPSFQIGESLHINELVDEEFTRFFSESVAVLPDEDEPRRMSLFDRFIRRRKEEEFPDAAQDEAVMMPGLSDPEPEEPLGEISFDLDPDAQEDQDETRVIDQNMSEVWPEEDEPQPERTPRRFRAFGSKEDPVTDGPFEEEEVCEPLEDYDAPEDAPAVQADLAGMRTGWGVRAILTGVLTAALLYLGLTTTGLLPSVAAIDPLQAPAPFLGVNLIFLAAAMALAWDVVRDGLLGIARTPSSQTIPVLAALGAAVQLVVLLIQNSAYDPEKTTLFAAPAALLLCFCLAGKTLMGRVVERNFQMVSQGIDHAAAYRMESRELTEKVAQGMGEPAPCLLVSRPTALVKGFLRQSFSQAPGDGLAQKLSWALLGISVAAFALSLVRGGDLPTAVSVLAGTLALAGPLSCTLVSAVSCRRMQRSAARVGAVVPGWSAVQELGDANMVMVDAKDLFPEHSVLLHGIKTFEKERIDLAILYAASILIQGCGTLGKVFMNIIQDKTEMLYPVENLNCEVGYGFSGWIQHNRVLVGNRQMMQKHDIELPSLDYEERYTKQVRQPVYLAVSGKLFGMFVVSYHPDKTVNAVVQDLHRGGISILVNSDDFSITSSLVAGAYGLPEGSVKVLSAQDRKDLSPATTYLPQSEGCLTHIGTFASMVGGLQAAAGAASGAHSAGLVQAVGVGFSCALALLLTFTGGLAGLALPAVILYQAAWCALSLAVPLLKKY